MVFDPRGLLAGPGRNLHETGEGSAESGRRPFRANAEFDDQGGAGDARGSLAVGESTKPTSTGATLAAPVVSRPSWPPPTVPALVVWEDADRRIYVEWNGRHLQFGGCVGSRDVLAELIHELQGRLVTWPEPAAPQTNDTPCLSRTEDSIDAVAVR